MVPYNLRLRKTDNSKKESKYPELLYRATAFFTYEKFKFSVKVEMKSSIGVRLIKSFAVFVLVRNLEEVTSSAARDKILRLSEHYVYIFIKLCTSI